MVRIKVFRNKDGKPAENAKVYVIWGGIMSVTRVGKTDSRGEVLLDIDPPQKATISINGSHKEDRTLNADGNTFFI
jgi:hypothetical protein